MRRSATVGLLMASLMSGGCQTEPFRSIQEDLKSIFGPSKGAPALATGVRLYEEGKYAEAAESLSQALYFGLTSADRVKAHKTMAFIACVSGRPFACREEFRRALAIDPSLELSAAEAGHPSWGPVFRVVKTSH